MTVLYIQLYGVYKSVSTPYLYIFIAQAKINKLNLDPLQK